MPRFNPARWKPVDDSSPGYRTVDPKRVVIAQKERDGRTPCLCGCGEIPSGAKAKFAMGHDARHRGALIRAHLTGTELLILVDDAGGLTTCSAMERAERLGWKEYLDAAVLRREGKNREVLQKALGSERLVKVGRWEYTGQVAAVYRTGSEDMLLIEYVNKAGDVRQARVPAKDAPLA